MRHSITVDGAPESFWCGEDTHVLAAMEKARGRGIPVGCRNGGCGACKVRVTSGLYALGKMSRAVVSLQEQAEGCVLACRTYPRSDLHLVALRKTASVV